MLAKFQPAPAHLSEYEIEPITSPVKRNPIYTIRPIGTRFSAEFNGGGLCCTWPSGGTRMPFPPSIRRPIYVLPTALLILASFGYSAAVDEAPDHRLRNAHVIFHEM